MDIHDLRREYKERPVRKADLLADPLQQFRLWLDEAIRTEEIEPNAMALATFDGSLHCRHVLLKQIDQKGFVFFTNLNSPKARQLKQNPMAAAAFWWRELERQVTLEGNVEPVSSDLAAEYFSKRPRTSRLASWASEQQSAPLVSRDRLEEQYRLIEERFQNADVPCPPFWGGFRLIPKRIEFWQGRASRLHDRFEYQKLNAEWSLRQLYP